MRRTLFVVIALTVLVSPVLGQSNKIPGVWRLVEAVTSGSNPETVSNPQPSQYIFTKEVLQYRRCE